MYRNDYCDSPFQRITYLSGRSINPSNDMNIPTDMSIPTGLYQRATPEERKRHNDYIAASITFSEMEF